jgi:hypothetical protein
MNHYVYRSLVGDLTLAFILAISILAFVVVLAAGALLGLRGMIRKVRR